MPQWVMGPDGNPVYTDENGQIPAAELTEPDYADELLDPAAPTIQPTELPGESFAPDAVSGTGEAVAAPTAPPGTQPPPPPGASAPVPQPLQGSAGFSYGQGGFDAGRNAQVLGTQGRLYAEREQIKKELGQQENSEAVGAAYVNEQQRNAVMEMGQVEAERSNAMAGQYREMAKMHNMFAAAEVAASDVAAQRTSEYGARYEQALASVAAMNVKPGLDVSKGETLGFAAALFAQGFLQAQGVPVANVSGMVSQMIDRNIDLQLEKIKRGEKLAEGQRVMWEMARAEADDEATARQRMRGLMLASATAQIESEGAKYNSRLALAKSQGAAADLKAELFKTYADIRTRYFNMYMQRSGQSLEQWKAEVAASQGWANIGLRRDELELAKGKAGAGQQQPLGDVVYDTTDSGGGRPIAKFKPGLSDKTKEDVTLRAAGQAEFTQQLREYRELSQDAGKVYQGWGKAMLNPAFRQRVEQLRAGLGAAYVKAMSGAAATDAERVALMNRIPLNRLMQNDGEKLLRLATSDMQTQVLRTVGRELQAFTTQLSPEEAASLPRGTPLGTFGKAEAAEGEALRQNDADVLVEDRYTHSAKAITEPDADITHAKKDERASPAWTDYVRAATKAGVSERAIGTFEREPDKKFWEKKAQTLAPPFASRMEYLVKEANSSDERDASRAQKALSSLLDDPSLGYRANYLHHLLTSNPPRTIHVQDNPETPGNEGDLFREPAGTGILDFPDSE